MTLLSIVQEAATTLGLPKPSAVISSTDPNVMSFLSLVNQTGTELMRRHAWQALQTEQTFTTLAQAEQTDAVPTDFDRFINETFWNRTKTRRVNGPLSPQEWQQRKASVIGGVTDYFRQRGGAILIDPAPAAGQTMAFEYVSKNWVSGDKASMTADADEALIDENLLKLGAIWKFLKSRNMDYGEEFRTFEIEVGKAIAKDGGKSTLSMMSPGPRMPTAPVPPDGSWSVS